jgi:hypothetical protein
MVAVSIIDIKCKRDHVVFGHYRKVIAGRLLKCYIDEIKFDNIGVKGLPNETDVFCKECQKENIITRVGRIGLVHGRPAVVINHGGTKPIRT